MKAAKAAAVSYFNNNLLWVHTFELERYFLFAIEWSGDTPCVS